MSYLSLGDNENEDQFAPPLGGMSSNLGSLFGMNAQMDNRAGSNQSLTYTAPKPPKPEKAVKEPEKKPSSGGVAAAVAVTAYKYVGNQYKSQGKLGMALLSNYSERDYKILMYVSKQQPVATAKIFAEFMFNVQPNNYASFYDDQRQTWSILFPGSDQLVTFAKQICLAKYHCQAQPAVVVQDLAFGDGDTQALTSGDSVEAKYTGWLIQSQSGALGSIFDSNHNNEKTFRFKTGKGKVIKGWEEGMMGMKKGGKRFLVIPPTFAYGAKGAGNRIPPNSTLAFEVDILRLKHQSSGSPLPSAESSESAPQLAVHREGAGSFGSSIDAPFTGLPASDSDIKDDTVKGRTSSLNDQIVKTDAGDSTKAKLVSRMAKVGQAMLPVHAPAVKQDPIAVAPSPEVFQQQNPPDSHSTYSNSPGPVVQAPSPVVYPHADYQRAAYSPHVMPTVPVQVMQTSVPGNVNFQPAGIMAYNDLSRQTFTHTLQQFPQSGGDMLPAILAESRSSNSKLKTLMEKVDEVAENVSKLKSGSRESDYRQSTEIMDATQISFNIQRIVQENERVKKQILERDKLVHQQSDKITDLLRQNQKLVEQSHEQIEKRNVSFNERFGQTQEKTLQLEQEKLELTNKLGAATSKVCELQLSLANVTERANSLEKIAKVSSGQHENELKIQRLESELSSAQSLLETVKAENKKLEMTSRQNSSTALQEKDKKDEMKQLFEMEIKKLQNEVLSLKSGHAEELASLKSKYDSQTSATAHQQEQIEESWKAKCKEAVAKVSKAAQEKIDEINEEKLALIKKLENLQQKMLQMKEIIEVKLKNEETMKDQLEELETTKQRYDNLRKQAMLMKQKYEETIKELRENATEETQTSSADATTQIKSVMNKVFQEVRAKISTDKEYSGSEVIKVVLDVVKSTTLELLNSGGSAEEEEQEDESDEEGSGDGEPSDLEDSVEDSTAHQASLEGGSGLGQDSCTEENQNKTDACVIESVKPELRSASAHETEASENTVKDDGEVSIADERIAEDSPRQENKVIDTDSAECDQEKTGEFPAESSQDNAKLENEVASITSEQGHASMQTETSEPTEARPDSPASDTKPTPPPLFDDEDDDDNDLDWLS